MISYQAGTKSGNFVFGVVFLLVRPLFAAGGAIGAIEALDSNDQGALRTAGEVVVKFVVLCVGSMAAYLGWVHPWVRAYEVRLPGDGSVEFLCVLRTKRLLASDVTWLEKSRARVTVEDDDARELLVHSKNGSMRSSLRLFKRPAPESR